MLCFVMPRLFAMLDSVVLHEQHCLCFLSVLADAFQPALAFYVIISL